MRIQKILPQSDKASTDIDVYMIYDHMPSVGLDGCYSMTYDEIEQQLFGKNSYMSLFDQQSLKDKFFIFDSYINLEEFDNQPNVIFLPQFFLYCIDVFNQKTGSNQIDFGKKLTSFNCSMHNQRYNRILISCWLHNNQAQLNFNYTQSWDNDEKNTLLYELLKIGKLATWEGSKYKITCLDKKYIHSEFGGPFMYANCHEYKNLINCSAISIVANVNFWENGFCFDEKYLNAVLGGTIPLCDGYGVYDTVKKIGFDVFDDLIDTSYQYEPNPCIRTWSMLEKNRHLLEHGLEYVNRVDIQERILKNYYLTQDPTKILLNSFKNLNTESAQNSYLEKYQKHVLAADPNWPAIEL